MKDEAIYFLPVRDLQKREVVTCAPEDSLGKVASIMRDRNISGIVVCRDGIPLGVITDRDIRNRVADAPADIRYFPAAAVMSSPVQTLREDDYVFEAVYRMAKHNVHRLVVVDPEGRVAGILTDTDVVKLQTTTPLYFGRDIETAETLDELCRLNARLPSVVSYVCRAGARTRDALNLISHFHDTLTLRVIALLVRDRKPPLPRGFAYLALGSEGRREQTLKTDQDSAVVYDDDLSREDVLAVEEFSRRLIGALTHIGVPACPAGTMADAPQWRRSLAQWGEEVERWISTPSPENMLSYGAFCDLRTVYGDAGLEASIKGRIREAVARNDLFLAYVARNILRFPPPVGLFGGIKAERSGPQRGKVDLKKAGIFALTEGVSLVALEGGILDGGTRNKLEMLGEKGLLSAEQVSQVASAFNFLLYLRLKSQLREAEAGRPPTNCVDPNELSDTERQRLREALHAVAAFQAHLKDRYRVDFIAR